MQAKALWYVAPGRAELRAEAVAAPAADEVCVRALFGAISRGTERLVCEGRVPPGEFQRMRPPFMAGAFPFPVKYGYATVGRVEEGPAALRETTVFVLHPHQSLFIVPAEAIVPVPERIPPQRAVLAANMETALNALWDAAPGPADRIAVVGGGEVGAPLGGAFHSRRLRLIASQVGKVAPSHRPRWSHARRLAAALALLDDPALDCLLAPAVAFEELPARLPAILHSDTGAPCPLIRYLAD